MTKSSLTANKSGFSIYELSFSLLVIALLMATIVVPNVRYADINTQNQIAEDKLAVIRIALQAYKAKNGGYPCPANIVLSTANSSYGEAATDCKSTCPVGVNCDANSKAVSGGVPFKTLGISESAAIDTWDNKVTYVVDKNLTSTGICQINGSLIISDKTNTAITNKAAFVLTSHGESGLGAYKQDGTLNATCSTTDFDKENCDNDGVFMSYTASNVASATGIYDDLITYQLNQDVVSCPAGLLDCADWFDAADGCSVEFADGSTTLVSKLKNKASEGYDAIPKFTGEYAKLEKVTDRYPLFKNNGNHPMLYYVNDTNGFNDLHGLYSILKTPIRGINPYSTFVVFLIAEPVPSVGELLITPILYDRQLYGAGATNVALGIAIGICNTCPSGSETFYDGNFKITNSAHGNERNVTTGGADYSSIIDLNRGIYAETTNFPTGIPLIFGLIERDFGKTMIFSGKVRTDGFRLYYADDITELNIGQDAYNATYYIGEVVSFNHALTKEEETRLYDYFNKKWELFISIFMRNKGFTFLEIMFVLMIFGVISTSSIVMLRSVMYADSIPIQQKMTAIDAAILKFVKTNGRLPCPANYSSDIKSAAYGVENCSSPYSSTTVVLTNSSALGASSNEQVLIGAAPIRTLNLEDKFGVDDYNHKLTYAVVKKLTDGQDTYRNFTTTVSHTIKMTDRSATSLSLTSAPIAYAVISHGENAKGAFTREGVSVAACGTTGLDFANCDQNADFIDTYIDSNSTTEYDDLVLWKPLKLLNVENGFYKSVEQKKPFKYMLLKDKFSVSFGGSDYYIGNAYHHFLRTFTTVEFNSTENVELVQDSGYWPRMPKFKLTTGHKYLLIAGAPVRENGENVMYFMFNPGSTPGNTTRVYGTSENNGINGFNSSLAEAYLYLDLTTATAMTESYYEVQLYHYVQNGGRPFLFNGFEWNGYGGCCSIQTISSDMSNIEIWEW